MHIDLIGDWYRSTHYAYMSVLFSMCHCPLKYEQKRNLLIVRQKVNENAEKKTGFKTRYFLELRHHKMFCYYDNGHLSVCIALAWNLRMSRGFPAFLRQF